MDGLAADRLVAAQGLRVVAAQGMSSTMQPQKAAEPLNNKDSTASWIQVT